MSFAQKKTKPRSACASAQTDQHHFVCCLDGRIPTHAKTRISMLQLVSVAEEAGLNLTWTENPKDTFSHSVVHILFVNILKDNC